MKSPKLYVSDAGMATRLTGSRMAIDPGDRMTGPLLVTLVAQNLRALLGAWRPETTLGFWNVQGRHEVDFVVEEGERCVAIEVKGAARWGESDLTGLRRFLQVAPGCVAAVLACDTPRVVSLGDRLWAMPLGRLLARRGKGGRRRQGNRTPERPRISSLLLPFFTYNRHHVGKKD